MMTQERKCQRYQSKRYRYLRTRKQNKQKSFMVLTSDIFSKNKFLDLVEIRDLLQMWYFLDEICSSPSFETECLPRKRAEYLSSHLHCCNTRQHRRPVYSNATIPCWPSCWVRIQDGSETPINHVLHLHPAQGLPPPRSAAVPTSACSRHRAPPSSAAASPTAPPERHELRRVQAVPHRHRHRRWRRGRGVQ